MKKINVALIGAGFIADYHARSLLIQENVEIIAVAALPLEAAQKFAKKYSIKHATDDALSLVGRDDINTVILGLPNKFHAPYAIAFLKDGKDVLIEKPLAMNSNEGDQIIKTAQENKCVVMVGHMWRFDAEINYIKSVVDGTAPH
jgi:predicted dehydrogenase